ncbi:MAG: hypothetical protein ACI8PZ_001353 [Myxococcota bacterium]|jgi:hypothetical protein
MAPLALLFACGGAPEAERPRPPGTEPALDSGPSLNVTDTTVSTPSSRETAADTGDTGHTADTGDTGDTTAPTHTGDTGAPPRVPLPPSLTIVGEGELSIGAMMSVLEGFGGVGPDHLVFRLYVGPGEPNASYAVSGPLGRRGTASWRDIASGEVECDVGGPAPAGDVNRDGFADLWIGGHLFHGPFEEHRTCADAAARIVSPISYSPVGGFDADGDGWTDVAFSGNSQQIVVHYGPFEGQSPGWAHPAFDPWAHTLFDPDWCTVEQPTLWNLGPLTGPGSAVLGVGDNISYTCDQKIQLVDIAGPRGRRLTLDHRLAWMEFASDPVPLGDWDGDGVLDLYVSKGHLLLGPFSGEVATTSYAPYLDDMVAADIEMSHAVQDMTGDGLPEFVVSTRQDGYRDYLVPSTIPRDGYVHVPSVGVLLQEVVDRSGFENHPCTTGDFDGDGLGDLACGNSLAHDNAGEIQIWYGADVTFPTPG